MNNRILEDVFKKTARENWRLMAFLVAAVVGVVVTSLLPPQILKNIIDQYLVAGQGQGILLPAAGYLLVLLLVAGFDFWKEVLLVLLGQRIAGQIRNRMMKKMSRLPVDFFQKNETGDVASRFTNDVDAVSSLFSNGIVGMCTDCFRIIGIVFSIWLFSRSLGLVIAAVIPILYILTRSFQKKMLSAQLGNRILLGKVNTHISESMKNMRAVRIYGKKEYMEDRYREVLRDNYRTVEKVNFYDSVFPPVIQLIRAILIGIIVMLSSNQSLLTGMTLGMVAASIDLVSALFAPIEQLGMELQNIQQAFAGMIRVSQFLEEEEEKEKTAEYTAEYVLGRQTGVEIRFQKVSFGYREGELLLQNVDIQVASRDKIVLTGRTGAGKTTMFKLLLGIVSPVNGKVTLNGIEAEQIPDNEKRKLIGYVEQGFHGVRGTVAEQISLNDETISRSSVERVLRYVGLWEVVESLEKGMDTPFESGKYFSQGQKQLLSIARALVADPPILMLDEITANLDVVTEQNIRNVLEKAGRGRTILSISHRRSAASVRERIFVVEAGRVIEKKEQHSK